MTPSPPTPHGPDCGCGLDVADVARLLDAATLAEHIGIPRSTLRSHAARIAKGASQRPTWWREPHGQIAGGQVWSHAAAEEMRRALEQQKADEKNAKKRDQ